MELMFACMCFGFLGLSFVRNKWSSPLIYDNYTELIRHKIFKSKSLIQNSLLLIQYFVLYDNLLRQINFKLISRNTSFKTAVDILCMILNSSTRFPRFFGTVFIILKISHLVGSCKCLLSFCTFWTQIK